MPQPFHVEFLAEELRRRKEKNRLYSLRAFAKFLDLPASAVSRLLAGKQDMSVAVALQIIKKLKLEPDDQERFVFSVAQEKHEHTLSTLNQGADIDALSAALRESEERYRRLIESVDQGVGIHELVRDKKGAVIDARILRVNPAWESTTGVSQQKATASLFSELFPHSFPQLIVLYERAVKTRVAQRQEIYFADRDLWFDALIVPLEGDRYMAIGVNTTERKRNEERKSYLLGLKTLLQDLADPVQIQSAAAKYLGEHLKCTNVYYSEYDEARNRATVDAGYVAPGAKSLAGSYALSDFASATQKGREGVFIMEDARTLDTISEEERATYLSIPFLSAIYVALVKGGKLVAGLTALGAEPRKWRPLEAELLKETAELTWSAVARAQAEAALRRQTRFLEATLSAMPDPVYAFDRERKFAYANRAMLEIFGVTEGDFVGKGLSEVGYPAALIPHFERQMETLLREKKTIRDEIEFTSPSGRVTTYQYVWGPVLSQDGSVELGVGISRDTTERKALEQSMRESESRLALVFETLPLAIGIIDENGELLLSNREMRTYMPTSKIPSRDPSQTPRWKGFDANGKLVPPQDFPAAKALRGDEYPDGLRMAFAHDDGREEWIKLSSRAVRDPKGRITGAFIVVQPAPEKT